MMNSSKEPVTNETLSLCINRYLFNSDSPQRQEARRARILAEGIAARSILLSLYWVAEEPKSEAAKEAIVQIGGVPDKPIWDMTQHDDGTLRHRAYRLLIAYCDPETNLRLLKQMRNAKYVHSETTQRAIYGAMAVMFASGIGALSFFFTLEAACITMMSLLMVLIASERILMKWSQKNKPLHSLPHVLLLEIKDRRFSGVLAYGLKYGELEEWDRDEAQKQLESWLPEIVPEDKSCFQLYELRAMVELAASANDASTLLFLHALEQIGDRRIIPSLRWLAQDRTSPEVIGAVQHCIEHLKAGAGAEKETLLRASSPSEQPETLLRPVQNRPDEEADQLLRPR